MAEFNAAPIVKDARVEDGAAQDTGSPDPGVSCDRCGFPMIERSCKLVCVNCGSRIDCSDLSIYMD